jgi:phosphopantothenoylcysteine decarboxylase/phosphopantothenate--cysteine ligase
VEHRDVLRGKRILLGVTGSIAAYKAVELLRRLRERGAEVRVAMTEHAASFVSRLTFETLSGAPVLCDEFRGQERTAIGHIEITEGLDAAVVAPATANSIGKLAAGIADDSLTSALMAIDCPLVIAPAMNDRMYRNPVLRKNVEALAGMGVRFVEPDSGSLACGTVGQGRLADTERILAELSALFRPKELAGRTVLVSAGPTREFIDPVRFLSNPSSGKMGYALAAAAKDRGAEVLLVSGPTHLAPPPGVKIISVVSAGEMRDAVLGQAQNSDVIIMAAAVSDFKPREAVERKIKKGAAPDALPLERTADILLELGGMKVRPLLVGFAAETDDVEQNALQKLKEKNLDMIVVNDLLKHGSGFGTDTNAVTIFQRSGERYELPTLPKPEIAGTIIQFVVELLRRGASPVL